LLLESFFIRLLFLAGGGSLVCGGVVDLLRIFWSTSVEKGVRTRSFPFSLYFKFTSTVKEAMRSVVFEPGSGKTKSPACDQYNSFTLAAGYEIKLSHSPHWACCMSSQIVIRSRELGTQCILTLFKSLGLIASNFLPIRGPRHPIFSKKHRHQC
jgi:hypothetical protein